MNSNGNDSTPLSLPAPRSSFRLAKDMLIDFEAYEYEVRGTRIGMSYRESRLLCVLVKKYLASKRGYVPIGFLVRSIIPRYSDLYEPEQAVSQIVSGIRNKWGEAPYRPRFLVSVRNKGYQLRPEIGYGYMEDFSREELGRN